MFQASVIIPSHERAGSLLRTLESLVRQDLPAYLFEVIVVADSCSDGTEQAVKDFAVRAPYRLRVESHRRRNAAATRNAGARQADGETLIFLDDDIEAAPSLVRAHLSAQTNPKVVSIGYLKPSIPERPTQWHLEARLWWEGRYRDMRQPGYRFGYRDFFIGNCAMGAALFQELGGLAEDFHRLEDYEFGLRALKSGARLVYAPDAAGVHHDSTDLAKWMRRLRDEGVADVQMGNVHPELRRRLFGLLPLRGAAGLVQRLAFVLSDKGDFIVATGLRVATIFERLRLRRRRRSIVRTLQFFNYWRGVGSAVKSIRALNEWTEEGPNVAIVGRDAYSLDLMTVPAEPELTTILSEGSRIGLRVLMDGIEILQMPVEP